MLSSGSLSAVQHELHKASVLPNWTGHYHRHAAKAHLLTIYVQFDFTLLERSSGSSNDCVAGDLSSRDGFFKIGQL